MLRKQWVFIVLSLLIIVGTILPGFAQSRYQLKTPKGDELTLTAVNQKREADSLILYTPEYGPSTRTNAYGVEVSAEPVSGNQYKVIQRVSMAGNLPIPADGIVLSAMGNKRDLLMQSFEPGAIFTLKPVLIYENRLSVDAVNPTAETNPRGSGFPGFRGGNQLVIYDQAYGQETTGTNEFGFEVTVKNGRVVEAEGANSAILKEPDSYVISGHGKARQWIVNNAPIGARIERNGEALNSVVDKDTYLYQLNRVVSRIGQLNPKVIPMPLVHRIDALTEKAFEMSDQQVAEEAESLQKLLTPVLWSAYPAVPAKSLRAIWHRPSETSVADIRQSLTLIQKAGFNTVFLETYLHGNPIFPSTTFQQYHIPQTMPFKSNTDLLSTWLTEAHKRGMKVQVWFQTFYAGNKQFDNTSGSIIQTYPEWANIQRSALGLPSLPPSTLESGSYFLDPANDQVQTFLLALIQEIVTRYPIDGIQLDYIRYPASFPPDRYSYVATTWGYTSAGRSKFMAQGGMDPTTLTPSDSPEQWAKWNDFKTAQVNRFVQRAHDEIKLAKPHLPISAAVFPRIEDSLARKHQNWQLWADSGWVDFLAPMTLTSSLDVIAVDTKSLKQKTRLPVITGLFGPFNGNSPTDVVDQVWTAYGAGADGIAMFDTAHLTTTMANALQSGIFKFKSAK